MIVVGAGIILFGFGNGGIATGISNLWSHGGWFPNGFSGLLLSMQMVLFAYLGVELIGVTAGEAQNPKKHSQKQSITYFGEYYCSTLGLYSL